MGSTDSSGICGGSFPSYSVLTLWSDCVQAAKCIARDRWFSQGCAAGCEACTGDPARPACSTPSAPTLAEEFRTMAPDAGGDWSRTHPWRSPGAAPVFDACGVTGALAKEVQIWLVLGPQA